MDILLTPEPETESSRKRSAHLDEVMMPTARRIAAEQSRASDLMFHAAARGDRDEFNRLWNQHMLPRKQAENAPSSTPPKTTT